MKYIFTGAQGTGKTTILNEFKGTGVKIITEIVRKLSKEGININEQGDEKGQMIIFDKYEEILSMKETCISDRGLTDVLAYTTYLYENGKVSKDLVESQKERLKKYNQNNSDVLYFYFPIEFDVVDDGVRSTNEDFRKRIDELIKQNLIDSGGIYIEVRGSVEERLDIIEKSMLTA